MGAIHSTKIPTGPTWKRGPPQKVDPFFRNFSGWTEPIHWVLDRNFRKVWLNGSRPISGSEFECYNGREGRKPSRTPVKSFINFLVLTVSRKGVVAAIQFTVSVAGVELILHQLETWPRLLKLRLLVGWTAIVWYIHERVLSSGLST